MDDLISRAAAKKSLVAEYNRKRTGDGLHLAWIEKAIDDTPPAQQWIPCSERMPVSNGIYIVDDYRYGKHWIHTVGYMKRSNSWCEQHGIYYDDKYGRYDKQEGIIAWMPLPEPYAERRTDE